MEYIAPASGIEPIVMKKESAEFAQEDLSADIDLPDLCSLETPIASQWKFGFGASFQISKMATDMKAATGYGNCFRRCPPEISPFDSRGFSEIVWSGAEQSESKLRSVSDQGSPSAR